MVFRKYLVFRYLYTLNYDYILSYSFVAPKKYFGLEITFWYLTNIFIWMNEWMTFWYLNNILFSDKLDIWFYFWRSYIDNVCNSLNEWNVFVQSKWLLIYIYVQHQWIQTLSLYSRRQVEISTSSRDLYPPEPILKSHEMPCI